MNNQKILLFLHDKNTTLWKILFSYISQANIFKHQLYEKCLKSFLVSLGIFVVTNPLPYRKGIPKEKCFLWQDEGIQGESIFYFILFLKINLFIYLFLVHWVLVAARGLSLVVESGGYSCCRAWALGTRASVVVARGLQNVGSVVVVQGLSCSAACGIFPDQGSNPCPLHWQADS